MYNYCNLLMVLLPFKFNLFLSLFLNLVMLYSYFQFSIQKIKKNIYFNIFEIKILFYKNIIKIIKVI